LSKPVQRVFTAATNAEVAIWVPVPVLWEISLLAKAQRIRLRLPLHDYVEEHFFANGIHLIDMTPEDVLNAHAQAFTTDPWDTVIVAVAQRLECPLITKDRLLHEKRPCEIFWD
jgi:PIN domain nuclease of toxin-antitoxin system